jgi:hypothetical protein
MQAKFQKNRPLLVAALVAAACLGLTACDFDHVVVFFGPPSDADQGPSCDVFCVNTGEPVQGEPPEFDVPRGQKVRFLNATKQVVIVTLEYSSPDSTQIPDKVFRISPGKGTTKTIKGNLPVGTTIETRYEFGGPPGHGGPIMIVQPEEDDS